MTIQEYLSKVEKLFKLGNTPECSFQGDLQFLILSIIPNIVKNKNEELFDFELGSKKLKNLFENYKLGLSNLVLGFPVFKNEETRETNTPNLNAEIVKEIENGLGMTFTNEKDTESNVCFANSDEVRPEYKQSFAPIDLLDYIYAVLHSPTYREKYKEFLKIDFPRVPYPTDQNIFWQLVKLGGELRKIHLFESPTVEKYITQYPEDGDNIVVKPNFVISSNFVIPTTEESHHDEMLHAVQHDKTGRIHINETQYFANVPEVAWNFYIGGYQPAQKWLKNRNEKELTYEDILHYQKIIVALNETNLIMKEIGTIEI